MKYTAVDLTHLKLGRSFRGYKQSDVDDLLREVASELEESARSRVHLEKQIETLRNELSRYKDMEETLNNAILLAQRTADDVKSQARAEAELIIKQANQHSREILQKADQEREDVHRQVRQIAHRREMFLDTLKSATRDLEDWLNHRPWEEMLQLPGATEARVTTDISMQAMEAGIQEVEITTPVAEADGAEEEMLEEDSYSKEALA